jgi:glycosyltransferase involved in cell wall biosynthesis
MSSLKHPVTPRVVIDARMVGPVPHGFSRYVTRMAEGMKLLIQKSPLPYEPVFLVGPEILNGPSSPFGFFETVRIGAPFLNPLEMFEIPVVLKKLGASLYHSPTFSSLYRSPCPWVVTVHDLNHLSYGGFKERLYYERLLKPFAQKSKALITVSEFSRQALAKWLGRGEDSIEIVYNSMDPGYLQPVTAEEADPVLARFGLERGRYFICLSNSKPHKNIARLVEAYRGYRQSVPEGQALPLVLSMNEFQGVPGIRSLDSLPDHEGRVLVASARAVVFPSLYEGFGLPPVEAATMGVPVLVSNIAPHREGLCELRQDEAVWVDAEDTQGWSDSLRRATLETPVTPSAESRMKLLTRFDPRRMGQSMDRIYRGALSTGAPNV